MALIRSVNAAQMTRDAVVLDLGDLQRQGRLLIEDARRRADAILAEAQAERERLIAGAADVGRREGLARGTEEGRRKGEQEGREAALAAHQPVLEQVQGAWIDALGSFEASRAGMLREARTDVLRLAAAIAAKVVKRAVELDGTIVAAQLGAVLAQIVRPTSLTVAVHPDDLAVAEGALPGMLQRFRAVEHAELVPDASLPRGSCAVCSRDAGGGEIDASIDGQLDRIVGALLPGGATHAADAPAPGGAA